MSESDEREAIERWRRRIDELDASILELLNQRSRCALEIGSAKGRLGLPVYDPEREAGILRRVVSGNTGPLGEDAVRRVFERILDESRRLERTAGGPAGPSRGEPEE